MGLCVLHGPGMGRRVGQGCGDPGSGHRQGLKTLHVCGVYLSPEQLAHDDFL